MLKTSLCVVPGLLELGIKMAFVRAVSIAVSVALFASPAAAAPYALVGMHGGVVWFVDTQMAGRRADGYLQLESYVVSVDKAPYHLARRLDEYDCPGGRSRLVKMENLNYADDRAELAYQGDRPLETPLPGSPAAVALKLACAKDFSSSQVSGQGLSPAAYATVIRTEQLNYRPPPSP